MPKKLSFFLLAIVLFIGCSSNNSSNTDTTTDTTVPATTANTATADTSKEEENSIPILLIKPEQWGDAPDFIVPDLDGNKFMLSSLKGKIIILDFWATWCGPCRKEIPHFIELYKEYKEDGLEIVGIALDKEKETVVAPYVKEAGINYIIVFGDKALTKMYGDIRGIPTTFIIDKQGNIVEKHIGYASKSYFEKEIKKLLEMKADR